MNRREASKQETRRLILRAARRLFAGKRAEEWTLRDVARKAGVSPASVVVHFKNKTGLLGAALDADIEKTRVDLAASLPAGRGLLESLMYLAEGFFRLYDGNRSLYRALIRQTLFEPWSDTPHMTKQSERYLRLLADLIEAEKSRGRIRRDVETEAVAGALFSIYLGALIQFFRRPEATVEMAVAALSAMTAQYLTGIEIHHENIADPARKTPKGPGR